MNEIFKKEIELLSNPISALIKEKLNDGFKNRQGRSIHSIEDISIMNIDIDEEKSSLKETVIVTKVIAFAKIWVKFEDGRMNDNIQISLSKPVVLEYDFGAKEYFIKNSIELALVDRSY